MDPNPASSVVDPSNISQAISHLEAGIEARELRGIDPANDPVSARKKQEIKVLRAKLKNQTAEVGQAAAPNS